MTEQDRARARERLTLTQPVRLDRQPDAATKPPKTTRNPAG